MFKFHDEMFRDADLFIKIQFSQHTTPPISKLILIVVLLINGYQITPLNVVI